MKRWKKVVRGWACGRSGLIQNVAEPDGCRADAGRGGSSCELDEDEAMHSNGEEKRKNGRYCLQQ
jgi:hypothetical protein